MNNRAWLGVTVAVALAAGAGGWWVAHRPAPTPVTSQTEYAALARTNQAPFVASAVQLERIGKAIKAFAAQHGGAGPAEIHEIASSDKLYGPADLECPIPGHFYAYIPYRDSDPDSKVVAYDRAADFDQAKSEPANVLYHDGHVAPVTAIEADKIAFGSHP